MRKKLKSSAVPSADLAKAQNSKDDTSISRSRSNRQVKPTQQLLAEEEPIHTYSPIQGMDSDDPLRIKEECEDLDNNQEDTNSDVTLLPACPSGHRADIFSYIRQCYRHNTFSDLILQTSADLSVSLHVHRLVLCSVFPNLLMLLSDSEEEEQQQLVILADIPVAELVTLLDSIYTSLTHSGEVVVSVPKGIQELFAGAGTDKKKEEKLVLVSDLEIKEEFVGEDLDEVYIHPLAGIKAFIISVSRYIKKICGMH